MLVRLLALRGGALLDLENTAPAPAAVLPAEMLPPKARPASSAVVARRLIGGALNLRLRWVGAGPAGQHSPRVCLIVRFALLVLLLAWPGRPLLGVCPPPPPPPLLPSLAGGHLPLDPPPKEIPSYLASAAPAGASPCRDRDGEQQLAAARRQQREQEEERQKAATAAWDD